jgi:hypothetical protein
MLLRLQLSIRPNCNSAAAITLGNSSSRESSFTCCGWYFSYHQLVQPSSLCFYSTTSYMRQSVSNVNVRCPLLSADVTESEIFHENTQQTIQYVRVSGYARKLCFLTARWSTPNTIQYVHVSGYARKLCFLTARWSTPNLQQIQRCAAIIIVHFLSKYTRSLTVLFTFLFTTYQHTTFLFRGRVPGGRLHTCKSQNVVLLLKSSVATINRRNNESHSYSYSGYANCTWQQLNYRLDIRWAIHGAHIEV